MASSLSEDLFLPKTEAVPRQPPFLNAAIFLPLYLKNFTAKLRASPSHTAARPPPGVCPGYTLSERCKRSLQTDRCASSAAELLTSSCAQVGYTIARCQQQVSLTAHITWQHHSIAGAEAVMPDRYVTGNFTLRQAALYERLHLNVH